MKQIISIILIILFCNGCSGFLEGISGGDDNLSNDELVEKYFYISKDNLNGWEQGYTDGNNYILGSHYSNSDSTIFLISSSNKPDSYCYFLFNEDNSLIGLGTDDNWVSTFEEEHMLYLYWLDANNTICGDYIELMAQYNSGYETKSISSEILFDYEKMSKITSAIGYIQNSNNINKHTIEKEYGLLAKDLMSLSASLILDLLKAPAKLNIALFLGELWIDGFVSTHYKRFQLALYNECTTEIAEISDDGIGNINVFVTIKNADSVPTELVRLYYPSDEDITNTVYCGIVGREGVFPTSVVFTKPYKEERLLDRNWGKEISLMYTFPIPNSDESCVFRSYLKSTRISNDNGTVNNGYIKYSKPYYYNSIGYIDQFIQDSCTIIDGYYTFKCKAHASIMSTNTNEWGIYHSDDNIFPEKYYPKEYPEASIGSPNQAEFELEFKYPIKDFENESYKYIKLGVFSYNKNDNLTTWGNLQQFTLEVTTPTITISAHTSEPKDLGNEVFSMEFDITCDKLYDNYHILVHNGDINTEYDSFTGEEIEVDEDDSVYDLSGSNLFNTISCEFNPIYHSDYIPKYRHRLVFIPCKYNQQKRTYTIIEKPIIKDIVFPAILPEYCVVSSTKAWDLGNTMPFYHSGNSGYDNPIFSIQLIADLDSDGNPIPIEFKILPTKYRDWTYQIGADFFGIVTNSPTNNIVLSGKKSYYVTINMKQRTLYWE